MVVQRNKKKSIAPCHVNLCELGVWTLRDRHGVCSDTREHADPCLNLLSVVLEDWPGF